MYHPYLRGKQNELGMDGFGDFLIVGDDRFTQSYLKRTTDQGLNDFSQHSKLLNQNGVV